MVAGRPGEGDLAVGVLNSGVDGDDDVATARGGRPLRGGAAGVALAVPVWGLRRSTDTAVCLPPMSRRKNLGSLSRTL